MALATGVLAMAPQSNEGIAGQHFAAVFYWIDNLNAAYWKNGSWATVKFWNDELRLCPKCRASLKLKDELRTECPQCHSRVWFFNYQPVPPPPDVPEPRPLGLWNNPTTTLLLLAVAFWGLVALVGIYQHYFIAFASALGAIGFAIFGFLRHAETQRLEDRLRHTKRIRRYAETMRNRVKELTARYNHLLQTGDARIEHYYDAIYVRAAEERARAEDLRKRVDADRQAIKSVEQRIDAMAERLISDHLKWTAKKLRPDPENYQRRKSELEKMFDFVAAVGYSLPPRLRKDTLRALKGDYEKVVREQKIKEEQRRIKQQMREEEKLRREREEALRRAEDREREIQQRLEEALRQHKEDHNIEIEELQRQLAEAHANSERAKSMAQITKAGNVYILSNIGSFGEDVFKVGMTRRLEPLDRVKELGDASVPFPFDVHAMISCDDAPGLENALHRELTRYRVNRINLRKEFFKVDLQTILDVVRLHHGEIEYVAEPEALEYRETLGINPEDLIEFESELAEIGVSIEGDEE